jgi:hypothetical protein
MPDISKFRMHVLLIYKMIKSIDYFVALAHAVVSNSKMGDGFIKR